MTELAHQRRPCLTHVISATRTSKSHRNSNRAPSNVITATPARVGKPAGKASGTCLDANTNSKIHAPASLRPPGILHKDQTETSQQQPLHEDFMSRTRSTPTCPAPQAKCKSSAQTSCTEVAPLCSQPAGHIAAKQRRPARLPGGKAACHVSHSAAISRIVACDLRAPPPPLKQHFFDML